MTKPNFIYKVLTLVVISLSNFISSAVLAEDLGIISIQSTTIDDRFENKRDEAAW